MYDKYTDISIYLSYKVMMFEYRIVHVRGCLTKTLEEGINAFAKQGWRVSKILKTSSENGFKILVEREIKQ